MNTILEETPAQTRMGVGFGPHRKGADAWKQSIGTKKVPARLEMLPEGESRLNRVGASAAVQIVLLSFFVALPVFFPERMNTLRNMAFIPLAMPVTEVPVAPPPRPPKIRKVEVKPEIVEPVKLNPKQPHIFVQQKVLQPKIEKLEAKAPELVAMNTFESKIETQTSQPKRPKEDVKVNNLSSGSAAPATVNLPVNKVQTGGFGDPNGLPGKGDPNKTTNVARLGSPALPGGDGYGNGTGGAKGVRGTVASTGFGNGIANPPEGGGGKRGTVQSGGFADQSVVTEGPKKKAASADSGTATVTIVDKPRPEYTAEGRRLKIEGDVALDVVFLANGTVQVKGVVSGLGHGLDEAAARAAQQIKFKPAKRDGEVVDFPARVRIEFRLAY
ncbi:MAG TPA: energy transducer TonB [Candidatus Eisenbacteria bacterium]|jgi:TonB family protein|nr:energy transducer TonB [Candidatus Eisenbacteria bacterium]